MEKNIFEFATRNRLRFQYKGSASVEDLWQLSVQELDSIYKALKAQEKEANGESLLQVKTKEDAVLEAKISIVKHIVEVKLAEAEKAKKALENKQKRDRILSIMADKQDAALQNMSMEELQKQLEELEG